jgi:hypothetical protein
MLKKVWLYLVISDFGMPDLLIADFNGQQSTVNGQQSTVNSQRSTVN